MAYDVALVAIIAVQALDLLGHWINHRKLKRAEARLEAAEKRGVAMQGDLGVIRAAFEEAAQQPPPTPAAQVDPALSEKMSEVRAAREEKRALRAMREAEIAAQLPPALIATIKAVAPGAWKEALNPDNEWASILAPFLAQVKAKANGANGHSPQPLVGYVNG